MAITPDTKDWTWVLHRPCPECGTEAASHDPSTIPALLEDAVDRWQAVLRRPEVARRPDDATWSPLEYAAHVSEVCRVFADRLALMLTADEPTFADWDQDAAALDGDYGARSPQAVGDELRVNTAQLAHAFADVPREQWQRRGLRGDGAPFTVRTLAQYFAHDVRHHLHDVDG